MILRRVPNWSEGWYPCLRCHSQLMINYNGASDRVEHCGLVYWIKYELVIEEKEVQ